MPVIADVVLHNFIMDGCSLQLKHHWEIIVFHILLWYANLLSILNSHCNYCLEPQWTALHMAAREDYKNTVECLVNNGADVNIKNDDGASVWEYCIKYCSIQFEYHSFISFVLKRTMYLLLRFTVFRSVCYTTLSRCQSISFIWISKIDSLQALKIIVLTTQSWMYLLLANLTTGDIHRSAWSQSILVLLFLTIRWLHFMW